MHIHRFFADSGLTLVNMKPDDAVVGDDPAKFKCIHNHHSYIIYLANPDRREPEEADVSTTVPAVVVQLPMGAFTAKWYNPRQGQWMAGSTISGGSQRLKAPGPGDWICLVTVAETNVGQWERFERVLTNETAWDTSVLWPLDAQETLWPGNMYHPRYTDEDIRRNAFVMLFSGAMINYGDMNGNSSSGFSNSMNPAEAVAARHATIHRVWDAFATLPWYRLKPRPDLVNTGYCLADPGHEYVVYMEKPTPVSVKVRRGTHEVNWINARCPDDRRSGGETSSGRDLQTPAAGDWILWLTRVPAKEGQDAVRSPE